MDYQVLARKWRPRHFADLVGQEALVRTLSHAFTHHRLHHAYLFTGTHGVGKTTAARIVAKCLNCETGITATPCDQCSACININQGRFVDLIEVDAASRTRVEDTRDLLDNVQYAPTSGRYKVYLIDEVHMLSGHSFNALLKTLEEPPAHVIFLLATTDPERLPKTVLSRCLQFHLKNISPENICEQLEKILTIEKISFEKNAIQRLARSAHGSMRDALTLLDQAIAHGQGKLTEESVKALLGSIDHDDLLIFIDAIATQDTQRLHSGLKQLADYRCNYAQAAETLLSLLHHMALIQFFPDLKADFFIERADELAKLSKKFSAEELQLLYQIALLGRRDLSLAPTPKSGFEMLALRLFAFAPSFTAEESKTAPTPPPQKQAPLTSTPTAKNTNNNKAIEQKKASFSEWSAIVPQLKLSGMSQMLAQHCSLHRLTETQIDLLISSQQQPLLNPGAQTRLEHALAAYFEKPMKLSIKINDHGTATPAEEKQHLIKQKQQTLIDTVKQDENVQALLDAFNTELKPNSIEEV